MTAPWARSRRHREWLIVLGALLGALLLPLAVIALIARLVPGDSTGGEANAPATVSNPGPTASSTAHAPQVRPPTHMSGRAAAPAISPPEAPEEDDPLRPHLPVGEGRAPDDVESGLPPALFQKLSQFEQRGVNVQQTFKSKATDDQLRMVKEVFAREQETAQLAVGRYRLRKLDAQQAIDVIEGAERAFLRETARVLGIDAHRLQETTEPAAPDRR